MNRQNLTTNGRQCAINSHNGPSPTPSQFMLLLFFLIVKTHTLRITFYESFRFEGRLK